MDEYRELDKPTATSAAEQQHVVLDAWQMIVADFDAEMADGKETFTQNPTQQSVEDEYRIYTAGALSAGSTVGTLGFWTVRCLLFCYNIYSYHLSTDARAYFPNYIPYRYGLFAYTGIRCPMRKGFFVQRGDGHKKEE